MTNRFLVTSATYMKFILAKKIEMTQRFAEDGAVTPVTVVEAGPCVVTQVRSVEQDGYTAIQVGFGERKHLAKPQRGHAKDLGAPRFVREFRVADAGAVKRGDRITVQAFTAGDIVQVVGVSKGKGYQGVVRRHGFGGSKATHGNKDQLRTSGSIGATDAARVFKGRRMAGHMGTDRVTIKNLSIIDIDTEHNLLYVKGAVPGARNGLLLISGDGELVIETPVTEQKPTSEASVPVAPAVETADTQSEVPATPEENKPTTK